MFFRSGGSIKKKKTRPAKDRRTLVGTMKVLAVVCVLAAIVIAFIFLEKYVAKTATSAAKTGFIELVNPPQWLNESLKKKVMDAAIADGEDLQLDEDVAWSVQQNMEAIVAWMDDVEVTATHESIRIKARWRKPVALIKFGRHKFYVDSELVVLDYIAMPNLPIVRVDGLAGIKRNSPPGVKLLEDDLAAAVALLTKLDDIDKSTIPDKPLLLEIDRIDMSNFNGRKNSRAAHIILYAKDNTEIIWGAELGTWQRHLEATDEQKLAGLYEHYKKYGSLMNNVKYINLQVPQRNVPQPIDKY